MGETTIRAILKGPEVQDGTIELRRLVQFGDSLQLAIDRMAYAIEKQNGGRRSLNQIRGDTAMRLTGVARGSFVAEMSLSRPQVLFEDYYDSGSVAVVNLITGLHFLRSSMNGVLPENYDRGVLIVLKDLGKMLRHGVESIEFEVNTAKGQVTALYDGYTRERIDESISEPDEKIAAVRGHLLMANFGREHYRCHLYYDDKEYISCTFDEDVSDEIHHAFRHYVYVIGVATIEAVEDKIASLHVKKLIVLDEAPVAQEQLTEALELYITANDTLANFQQSWKEAMAGQGSPVSSLWDDIDAE